MEITELVMEPGDGVVGQTEVGTDALGSVLLRSRDRENRCWY